MTRRLGDGKRLVALLHVPRASNFANSSRVVRTGVTSIPRIHKSPSGSGLIFRLSDGNRSSRARSQ